MGADAIVGTLTAPIGIMVWIGLLLGCSVAVYRMNSPIVSIHPFRLFTGYLAAIAVCVGISALSAYVPIEEAATRWHVRPEHYDQAIRNEFISTLAIVTIFATTGIALIGVPIIFRLARLGRAQIGEVLIVSVKVSLAFSAVLSLFSFSSIQSWLKLILPLAGYSTGLHLLLSLGFCIGAGLPWKVSDI